MNGPIAQAVALTCHGNAALRASSPSDFFAGNSTCQFCDAVTFVRLGKSWLGKAKEELVAEAPARWFERLRGEKTRGLRLVRETGSGPLSDRTSAGFVGGGGDWFIETVGADAKSRFWIARWKVWNQAAPDRRIWRVTYGLVAERTTETRALASLEQVMSEMLGALHDIEAFARQHDCGYFADCFAKAIESLMASDNPKQGYHRDLAPSGLLSDQAARALDACQSAWVFGGMGSWNDLGFDGEDQRLYDRVSERLFKAVNAAIAAATNTSFRSTPEG